MFRSTVQVSLQFMFVSVILQEFDYCLLNSVDLRDLLGKFPVYTSMNIFQCFEKLS